MNPRRVAIVFENQSRPETTGFYCRRALGELTDVEHFLPNELASLAAKDFDLFLNVDDGFRYRWPRHLRPSAYWAIDTHLDPEWAQTKARDFDYVFAAQRDGAAQFQAAGLATAAWLPLACDPHFHRPHEVNKEFDVCFIGNLFPGERSDLVRLLQQHFPKSLVARRYFEEMAKAYAESRVVFNRSLRNDINMRVFEAVACGSLLLTNNLSDNGQDELFRDGTHLATYRDSEELLDKVRYYLRHPEIRERIAAKGRQAAHESHTYRRRMEELLRTISARADSARVTVAAGSAPSAAAGPAGDYFEWERPELLALVPTTVRRALDVGCGTGRLGASLKERQGARVVGWELDPKAARLALDRLDDCLTGDLESTPAPFQEQEFDCLICGDVLEHLRDPDRFLRRAREWLTDDAIVVASIPNVRHHTVVSSLLAGNWTYEMAGLLDRTHVRFFTRREIEKLFFRAGYEVESLQSKPGPGHAEWVAAGSPNRVQVGRLQIAGLSAAEAEEFYTYQFLVVAKPRPRKADHRGLTSIVIATFNEVACTRMCLESIRLRTDEPYELIVVDNASTDGTLEYLKSCPDVRLIRNETNRGFPAAANQGIQASRGEQILLLNNDVIVTTGWLARMLDVFVSEPQVGLVGPCTNNISGPQQVPVTYQQLEDLDGFAWDWCRARRGVRESVDRLVGFCLLFRRQVSNHIGLLDERFGIGNFEDDDFCRRALAAGYGAVIARDSFVHHFGSQSFKANRVNLRELLENNEKLYREKWREQATPPLPSASQVETNRIPAPKFTADTTGSNGWRLKRQSILCSLVMIARDNEQTIGPCLESIRPWVDEMIVVDTGSRDRTPDICRQMGARVFEFPWVDSFSAARNESLRHAQGEWVFWMDTDDTIPPHCGAGLRDLVRGPHKPEMLGYVAQVHCPGGGARGHLDTTVVDHVKLFRNRPDLRFEFRIHEQIIPAIRRASGEVGWTDLYVVHSGADHTPAGRARKLKRDFHLLSLDLKDHPEHPFVLFNFGMTHADAGEHDLAVDYLRRSITASDPSESQVRKAYALLVSSLTHGGRLAEANAACEAGRSLFPDDAELLFREGLLAQQEGRMSEAERAYRQVLEVREARHYSSCDRGICGFKTRHNLAMVLAEAGKWSQAEEQWRAIIEEIPEYREGWYGLADLLLQRGKRAEVRSVVEELKNHFGLSSVGHVIEGRLARAEGQLSWSREAFRAAATGPDAEGEGLRAWAQCLFESGELAAALDPLQNLVARHPDDPSAQHNLGTALLHAHRPAEAMQHFQESLRLRPGSASTWEQAGYGHEALGEITEAVSAWRQAEVSGLNSSALRDKLRQYERTQFRGGNGERK
ncbi:MAG: glycosyltransferase [Pirellulales bacterium]